MTQQMSEAKQKRRKKKKQQFAVLDVQDETQVAEVIQALEELAKQGKHLDIQVCPKCKSPKIRRAKTMGGDLWSHLGWAPPKYECPDCGWNARLVLKATNKPMTVREVELIAEAREMEESSKE